MLWRNCEMTSSIGTLVPSMVVFKIVSKTTNYFIEGGHKVLGTVTFFKVWLFYYKLEKKFFFENVYYGQGRRHVWKAYKRQERERASERARERTREKTAFFPYSFVFEPIFMNHMYTEFDEESKSDIKMAKIWFFTCLRAKMGIKLAIFTIFAVNFS